MAKFLWSSAIALGCLAGLVLIAGLLVLASVPRPTNIKECLTTEMYKVRLCPKDANYVKLSQISKVARNAVIVSEDGSFYQHNGFDWHELQKSIEKDLDTGEFARGGSTITQQLAKNVYLSPEKSIFRKIKEAMITVELEKTLTKDEILEKYLNVVEFGKDLYGIKRASQLYFKKSPAELTAAEGAFLAFLLPNPKKYSQSFHQKKLTKFAGRQVRVIVDRLFSFKMIDEAEHASALAEITQLFGADVGGAADEPLDEAPLTDEDGAPVYPAGLEPLHTEDD